MKVALVSLNQSWENKQENRVKVEDTLTRICNSKNSVDWVVYPEMTLTGFTMNAEAVKEDKISSETIKFFKKCAIKHKIYISFGVVLKENDKATNNLVVISPQGIVEELYAKIHPFSYAGEDKIYNGGTQLAFCQINGVKVGLTICYDLRFPELYQALSKDCDVILNIANWPKNRVNHWNLLLRARALENQVFMIGVNRIGIDANKNEYALSSQIISPYGEELNHNELDDEIRFYEFNEEDVYKYRTSFPLKKDRKISLYKEFL